MTKQQFYIRVKFIKHFFSLVKGVGLIAAIRIDLVQLFKTVRYKHDYVLSFLERRYADIIEKYRHKEQDGDVLSNDCTVWVCWFQGETNMPESIRYCSESIKKYVGQDRVQLITFENYRQFVTIPQYIIDKVDKGKISLTHFSDVLRSHLLADHGGMWIDASLLLTADLLIPALPFFSLKLRKPENDDAFVSDYRWTVGFMGGVKGNVLHSFMKDFFNAYYKKETVLIDYFLTDYAIAVAYKNIASVKKMVDDVPYSNEDFHYMGAKLFDAVDKEELRLVLKRSSVFRIGYKGFPQVISETSLYRNLFN